MTFEPGDQVVIQTGDKQELGKFVRKSVIMPKHSFVSCGSNLRYVCDEHISKMTYTRGDEVIVHRFESPSTTGVVLDPVPNIFGCIEVNYLNRTLSDGIELRRIGKIHLNRLTKVSTAHSPGHDGNDDDNPNVTFKLRRAHATKGKNGR